MDALKDQFRIYNISPLKFHAPNDQSSSKSKLDMVKAPKTNTSEINAFDNLLSPTIIKQHSNQNASSSIQRPPTLNVNLKKLLRHKRKPSQSVIQGTNENQLQKNNEQEKQKNLLNQSTQLSKSQIFGNLSKQIATQPSQINETNRSPDNHNNLKFLIDFSPQIRKRHQNITLKSESRQQLYLQRQSANDPQLEHSPAPSSNSQNKQQQQAQLSQQKQSQQQQQLQIEHLITEPSQTQNKRDEKQSSTSKLIHPLNFSQQQLAKVHSDQQQQQSQNSKFIQIVKGEKKKNNCSIAQIASHQQSSQSFTRINSISTLDQFSIKANNKQNQLNKNPSQTALIPSIQLTINQKINKQNQLEIQLENSSDQDQDNNDEGYEHAGEKLSEILKYIEDQHNKSVNEQVNSFIIECQERFLGVIKQLKLKQQGIIQEIFRKIYEITEYIFSSSKQAATKLGQLIPISNAQKQYTVEEPINKLGGSPIIRKLSRPEAIKVNRKSLILNSTQEPESNKLSNLQQIYSSKKIQGYNQIHRKIIDGKTQQQEQKPKHLSKFSVSDDKSSKSNSKTNEFNPIQTQQQYFIVGSQDNQMKSLEILQQQSPLQFHNSQVKKNMFGEQPKDFNKRKSVQNQVYQAPIIYPSETESEADSTNMKQVENKDIFFPQCCREGNTSPLKNGGLQLNLSKLKNASIVAEQNSDNKNDIKLDFQDEFMSNINEFSLSWRQALQRENQKFLQ